MIQINAFLTDREKLLKTNYFMNRVARNLKILQKAFVYNFIIILLFYYKGL